MDEQDKTRLHLDDPSCEDLPDDQFFRGLKATGVTPDRLVNPQVRQRFTEFLKASEAKKVA